MLLGIPSGSCQRVDGRRTTAACIRTAYLGIAIAQVRAYTHCVSALKPHVISTNIINQILSNSDTLMIKSHNVYRSAHDELILNHVDS